MNEIFGIDNFNVISDDENYYVYRALNKADCKDIENGITIGKKGEILRVRTDRERWEAEKEKAKYSEDSEISLEEIWNHIKMRYSKETNCISLSSNSNVSVDYGKYYDEKYIILKIPKSGKDDVVLAGQYMLKELKKVIDKKIDSLDRNSDIFNLIREIDNKNNASEINQVVSKSFKKAKSEGKYIGTNINLDKRDSISRRFSRKQYFSEKQQIEYNKIIAKLTILEMYGKIGSILKSTPDNSSLIRTIGNAFSSGELIHYKDITKEKDEFVNISKEMMDILSLVQQVKDNDRNNEKINKIERKILEYINSGKIFEINPTENEKTELLTVDKIYEVTEGKISYQKASEMIRFAQNLANSRMKTLQYVEILRQIVDHDPELDEIMDKIADTGFIIDSKIVTRKNNFGYKIAESVNLGMEEQHRRIISNDEQIQIINDIKKLKPNELPDMTIESVGKYIIQNYKNSAEQVSENRYYAETIVDGLDISKIYKNAIGEKYLSNDERDKLVTQLEQVDCKRLYNAFINAGVNANEISGYIINILANKGYKYNIQELCKLENLDEIINTNVKNNFLKNKVFALTLDELRGIKDNENIVDGTSIKLRDYQQQAVDNAEKIYQEGKRFAGVVLPTGAGKSFVAITEMLKHKNGNILYFAPQTEILNQIQKHILKNVVGVEVLNPEEVRKLEEQGIKIAPEGKIFPSQVKEYINKFFPHLKMFCYQSMSDAELDKLKESLGNADADLIIFDELHRVGAQTWEPLIKELIQKNKNANILGITATPIRDVDHRDMMKELAIATGTYSREELIQKKYLASEMYLVDAIQQGLVVEPKIVSFNYFLKETPQYLEVKKMIEEENNEKRKQELQKILHEMDEIIGTPENLMQQILNETDPYKKSSLQSEYDAIMKDISRYENAEIGKVIMENLAKKNGRNIVFLPRNSSGLLQDEYIQQQIEKVKDILKDIDSNPEAGYLSSTRSKADNHLAISNFESSKSEHLKLLFAIDKLNEGVHVDDINGEIMLRKISIGSKILYLQQLGRVVFSLEPGIEIPEDELPIVFDIYNNYLIQDMNKEINKKNITSDLQRMKSMVEWINKHQYIPDINSEEKEEARIAITLKRIQSKYSKYLDGINGKKLSETDIYEIEQILILAKSIGLFEMDIPERIIEPGEKDLSQVSLFKVTGTQKRFLELFQNATNVTKNSRKMSNDLRLSTVMSVLASLDQYDIEINNENISFNDTLKDVLEKVPKHIRENLVEDLEYNMSLDYKIGEEYNNAKVAFLDNKRNKYFKELDVRELYKYGIFDSIPKEYLDTLDEEYLSNLNLNVLERDFIIEGPKGLQKLNVKTGTYYDENGLNYDGKDEISSEQQKLDTLVNIISLIYEYIGSNIFVNNERKDASVRMILKKYLPYNSEILTNLPPRYYVHEEIKKVQDYVKKIKPNLDLETLILYKKMGIIPLDIDKNGIDSDTKISESTLRGVSENGFDKMQDYWEKDENGRLIKKGTYNSQGFNSKGLYKGKYKYDNNGYDFYGNFVKLDNHGFDDDGYYWEEDENKKLKRCGRLNRRNFSKDGTYCIVENDQIRERGKVNKYGFDIDEYYWEKDELTKEYRRTDSKLNECNFDTYGYYWEKDKNGVYHNTGQTVNRANFNISDGYNNFGINKSIVKSFIKGTHFNYDKRGFRENGYYKDSYSTISPIDGYDKNGYDENGYDIDGILNPKLSEYRENGLDRHNFSKSGYFFKFDEKTKKYKSTKQKYDNHGFKQNGKTEDGSIYNARGFKIYGVHKNGTKYDDEGYDIDGYDRNGFNKEGIHKDTKKLYDKHGFAANGINVNTGLKYDKYKFRIDGINVITNSYSDLLGFTIDGRNIYNNGKKVNEKGFDIDRIMTDKYGHKQIYGPDNLNAYGFSKDGKALNGRIHPSINFTKYYLQQIVLKGNSKERICKELAKECNVSETDMKTYIDRTTNMVFEGFPPIKKLFSNYIAKVEDAIQKKSQEIEKLLQDKSAKTEEIKRLEKANQILRNRIASVQEEFNTSQR